MDAFGQAALADTDRGPVDVADGSAELHFEPRRCRQAEPLTGVTLRWFLPKLGLSTFGIFDAFPEDTGRHAHLAGHIAAAPMAKAPELLAQPPTIEPVDILAAKLNR